jgi:hypothetical protein
MRRPGVRIPLPPSSAVPDNRERSLQPCGGIFLNDVETVAYRSRGAGSGGAPPDEAGERQRVTAWVFGVMPRLRVRTGPRAFRRGRQARHNFVSDVFTWFMQWRDSAGALQLLLAVLSV